MMELRPNNDINAGDSSQNNQAGTINITNNGLSYRDVKDICTDVFKANMTIMKEEATAVAEARAAEITEKFIERAKQEDPSIINEFATPGMQDSFFNAQKAYAIGDDGDLADMLVEMLIERAKLPLKNRKKIILDESLKVAPKLTGDQMDLLTLIHFRQRVRYLSIQDTSEFLERIAGPFSLVNSIDQAQVDDDLSLMELLGLGQLSLVSTYPNFGAYVRLKYPAYFMKGFSLEELNAPELEGKDILMATFHDHTKLQFIFEDKQMLIEKLKEFNLVEERINYIAGFFDAYVMSEHEITSYVEQRLPDIKKFNNIFDNTRLKSFAISSIGMAIALSNYQRRFGIKNDLSLWIK